MKVSAIIIAAATLFAAGEACKCFTGSNINFGASRNCCAQSGGRWTGDDCAFAGTGGNLGKFNSCCGQNEFTYFLKSVPETIGKLRSSFADTIGNRMSVYEYDIQSLVSGFVASGLGAVSGYYNSWATD
ncbi:hypothetical protein IF1G_10165 [Cordyceps javanica]|uniref:Uncharacterized protein n=1 Tax=Cordyceps javanica TaxID=43265 RepID=A0A545VMI4_9HYPO|nr:hypothetical protein IF1G_10165 [Cordyceps javanica]TQW02922.1 hypothetical protein IF2G_09439 [Cordyceps javanica]